MAASALKEQLPEIKKVLVLGAGIGSIIHVLRGHHAYPEIILVDNDPLILEWLVELTPKKNGQVIKTVLNDAVTLIAQSEEKYDLIFVDIFLGRIVPDTIKTVSFFSDCNNRVNAGGYIAFNWIYTNKKELAEVKKIFDTVFTNYRFVSEGINRVIIAQKPLD